ncbi:MAG: alpha-(1-_3)-arabinofuranosyltransferase family protein [Candidatus Gottesmanbacteria bacterium]
MRKIENIILTIILFSLSLIPLLWLSEHQVVLGYDAVYPLNPQAFLKDRLYSWSSTLGFSMDQSGVQGSLIIHFIDSVPQFLGLPAYWGQRVMMVMWFFTILLSAYIFIIRLEKAGIIKGRYLRYFFPILYTFNFYLLQAWWIIERTKFSLVVATPLILSLIMPMVQKPLTIGSVIKQALYCSIILAILNGGGWGGLALYGGLILILVIFYFFYAVSFYISKRKKDFLLISLFFIIFGISFFLLNAYTFLPLIFTTLGNYKALVSEVGGIDGIIEWTRYLSTNANVLNLLRLEGIPEWYDNTYHSFSFSYLKSIPLILISFLFPILIFLSIFNSREKKETRIFFMVLLVISLVFTAGISKPLGFFYEFLMRFVPGFFIFRSAIYKFGYAYWLSSSLLIGLSLSWLMEMLEKRISNYFWQRITVISIFLLTAGWLIVYHYPYLTGNLFPKNPSNISTRVEIPTYINDFSKWWVKTRSTDKILLLPKLNDIWLFEQYRWNYMSSFPITANYANQGIIENALNLTPNETNLVNKLYDSINSKDHNETDFLSSVLGIRYFLIRKDFYYDIPDQKTDNPSIIESKLMENPNIKKIATFGQWIVYRYSEEKPLFFVSTKAIQTTGTPNLNAYNFTSGKTIFPTIDKNIHEEYPDALMGTLVFPLCLNCEIGREEIPFAVPDPKILLDSPLYDLVTLKNKLLVPKNETIENRVFRLIGETIKMSSQIQSLIILGKGDEFIELAAKKHSDIWQNIFQEFPNIIDHSLNSYQTFYIIDQYLLGELNFFDNIMLTKVAGTRRNAIISLEKTIDTIDKRRNKLNNYINNTSDSEKRYKFDVPITGNYNIRINRQSLVYFDNEKDYTLKFLLDNKIITPQISLLDKYLDLGFSYLTSGKHIFSLYLPDSKNLVGKAYPEKITGRNCFSSLLNNFTTKDYYTLSFTAKNNFDAGFFFFIDHDNGFSPVYTNFIPLAGEQVKDFQVGISPQKIVLDRAANKLRVSFCAVGLDESHYNENIKNLIITKQIIPEIVLSYMPIESALPPDITFKEINQTHYQVAVNNSVDPFYLVFNQRYSPGWQSNTGEHLMADLYSNAWLIDNKGNFTVDITYKPQDLFNKGLLVTISYLIMIFGVLVVVKMKNI